MATIEPSFPLTDYPVEMVTAVAADAARDAHHVSTFLDALGLSATPEQPRALPASFLLHLGAGLRLLMWETQGFAFHRSAGLPAARQVIRAAFQALSEPQADPAELCVTVLRLSVEHFAWHGRRDLAADVALDDLVDDAALDALAEYLWASRRTGVTTLSPQP